jgi:hypothetical protein
VSKYCVTRNGKVVLVDKGGTIQDCLKAIMQYAAYCDNSNVNEITVSEVLEAGYQIEELK